MSTHSARTWTFDLNYPRPPKGLASNDRPNRWGKAAAIAAVRTEVMAKTRALHTGSLERIQVDIVWIVNTHHRRDEDGFDPFRKAIYDGIAANKGVSARIVDDDDPAHMVKPGPTIRYVKDATARFEITITEMP